MSGYAVIGIFLLVLTGSIISGSNIMDALDYYYNDNYGSHEAYYQRKSEFHHTEINITSVTYDLTGTTITLNNTGSNTLDPDYLSIFVDKIYAQPIISNTNIWLLPGNSMELNFTRTAEYGNHTLKIVTENGKFAETNFSSSGTIYLKHDETDNRIDVLNATRHSRLTDSGLVEDYDGGSNNQGANISLDNPYEWISEIFESNVRLTQDATISVWVMGKTGNNDGTFNLTLLERDQFGPDTIIGYGSTYNNNWPNSFTELNKTISISSYKIRKGSSLVLKGESQDISLEIWVAYDVNDPVEGLYYPSKVEIN